MLQKTQWMLASMVLLAGAGLMAAPRPAQAQVRIHLTRGSGVTTTLGTGIVIPPSGTGITTPPNSLGIVTPPPTSTGIVTPPPSNLGIVTPSSTPAPQATPVVTPPTPPANPPAPTVTQTPTSTVSRTIVSTPPPAPPAPPVVIPSTQAAPQGFSAGPSLLGSNRLDLGRYVDREGPAIIGDSGPTVQKVIAHH